MTDKKKKKKTMKSKQNNDKADTGHKHKIEIVEKEDMHEIDEQEQTFDLIMSNGYRLEDLAMALCSFDDEMAKQALAVAIGNLLGYNDECPCKHDLIEIIEAQMDAVKQHIDEHHSDIVDDDDNSGNGPGNGNGDLGSN